MQSALKEAEGLVWEEGTYRVGVNGVKSCKLTVEGLEIELASGKYDFLVGLTLGA